MDPITSPSAPPLEYIGGEESSMGQEPPPAYEDIYPGSPWPGYAPLQTQGYGPPPPGGGGVGYAPQLYAVGHQHPGQPTIVQPQPQPQPSVLVTQAPLVNNIKRFLFIILICICCLPITIAAVIYSAISAREADREGDQVQARPSGIPRWL